MLMNWLDQGLFPSQRRLAESLGCEHTAVSRAIGVAKLPQAVIQAFQSPLDIQYRDAELLRPAIEAAGNALIKTAEELAQASPKLRRPEVLKRLLSAAASQGVGSSNTTESIELKEGNQLLGLLTWTGDRQIRVTLSQRLSPEARNDLQDALIHHLQKSILKSSKKPRGSGATPR